MKKRNSWIAVVAVAALFVGVQAVQAGSSVADGAYVGVEGGFGTAVIDASTTTNSATNEKQANFSFTDGGIGMDGGSYGAFMGYGFRMAGLYVGAEVGGYWSDMTFNPGTIKVGINEDTQIAADEITGGEAELAFTASVNGRLGYYLNPTTLFVLNGGLVGSQFDVRWGNAGELGGSEEYWDPGTSYGVGIESALLDNVSVRLNWTFVDYYNAEVFGIGGITESSDGVSVEIQPTMGVAHLGVMYTF